jgi:23S rRNA (cytosine1962-C5)-methyltransferase
MARTAAAMMLLAATLPHAGAFRTSCVTTPRSLTSASRLSQHLQKYEFVDCGGFRRMERFGDLGVVRSCPTASWPVGAAGSWTGGGSTVEYEGTSGKAGQWTNSHLVPSEWRVTFDIGNGTEIAFALATSDQGQVGVFPEQQQNWRWIRRVLLDGGGGAEGSSLPRKVLNGFAYTGGSTMAALSAGNVQVTHLDAAKSSVAWAKGNAAALAVDEASSSVRWIVDDCVTFCEREVRRGNVYDGLVFDPPAFGRGGNGKVWKLEKDLPLLAEGLLPQLLSDDPLFVVLSCHDVDWPPSRLAHCLRTLLTTKAGAAGEGRWLGGRLAGQKKKAVGSREGVISSNEFLLQELAACGGVIEYGPMVLEPVSGGGRALPLGGFARWRRTC